MLFNKFCIKFDLVIKDFFNKELLKDSLEILGDKNLELELIPLLILFKDLEFSICLCCLYNLDSIPLFLLLILIKEPDFFTLFENNELVNILVCILIPPWNTTIIIIKFIK